MKRVKKLLIMLLAFAITVSVVSAAAFATDTAFTVQAKDVAAKAGDEVVMTVEVTSNPGVVAAILNIKYDSAKLTLKDAISAQFLNDAVEVNNLPGDCTVVLDNALEGNKTTTGDLLALTFTVKENVTEDVEVDLTVTEAVNTDLKNVSVSAVDGKITIGAEGPAVEDIEIPAALPEGNVSIETKDGKPTMTINPVTADPDKPVPACVVLIKDAAGNYTKVPAAKQEDGTYDFDVSALGGGELVVAVKGDASGDGVVDNMDVLRMKQLANSINLPQDDMYTFVGDIVGDDGAVDNTDVLRMKQVANAVGAALAW